jgi:hypothetical protein
MNKPAFDPSQPFRGLIAGYTDGIRSSDFKANIALLFIEFTMAPILWNYPRLPKYLPIELVMQPFLVAYICLFMVLLPRYPKRGAKNFRVARNLTAADFEIVSETEDTVDQLKLRCAILSNILWWKTLFLRISFGLSIVSIFLATAFLIQAWRA